MKFCPDCGDYRPLTDFPRNRSERDGLGGYCKPHHNARGKASVARRGGSRTYHLKRRYGVSEADVAQMVQEQGGVCAICGKPDPTHLDHDHATGKIRGVLCVPCNNGLGLFRDDPQLLLLAAVHLQRA